jgi:hypothetical protein
MECCRRAANSSEPSLATLWATIANSIEPPGDDRGFGEFVMKAVEWIVFARRSSLFRRENVSETATALDYVARFAAMGD